MKLLTEFKDVHKGETVVVIGNGPSLSKTPLDELSKKYATFGANAIYSLPFVPTYLTMIDEDMIRACMPELVKLDIETTFFLPAHIPFRGRIPINVVVNGEHPFSKDITKEVVMGGTVTYANLQIALYTNPDTVLLVGVDHNYPKASLGRPGAKFIADGEDPGHFKRGDGSPYFKEGFVYNRPELEATALSYAFAKRIYGELGKRIINLTPDTALDVFEKGEFEDWL